MGVAGLLPLLEPYMERIDPSAGLDGGLRCVVDAPAFIHQLLKRHAPQIMLSDSWLGFDKDVRVLLGARGARYCSRCGGSDFRRGSAS